MSRRKIAVALTTCLLVSSAPSRAEPGPAAVSEDGRRWGYSEHYGVVTPRDVFALATNFNVVLDYYLETHEAKRAAELNTLVPETVSDKGSEDLLVRSRRLADLVDRLAAGRHLPPVLRIERHGDTALPAEAFLQVGASLDGLIFFLSALDASQIWGDYYVTVPVKDEKTPDDAYAVLDLAVRKLEILTMPASAEDGPAPSADASAADAPVAGSAAAGPDIAEPGPAAGPAPDPSTPAAGA